MFSCFPPWRYIYPTARFWIPADKHIFRTHTDANDVNIHEGSVVVLCTYVWSP